MTQEISLLFHFTSCRAGPNFGRRAFSLLLDGRNLLFRCSVLCSSIKLGCTSTLPPSSFRSLAVFASEIHAADRNSSHAFALQLCLRNSFFLLFEIMMNATVAS
ncbi:hypothetical protein K1719_040673 [Acacia pycnantha]|nr:hypothetical protein K1719_040673 [Acacia pycnantha]